MQASRQAGKQAGKQARRQERKQDLVRLLDFDLILLSDGFYLKSPVPQMREQIKVARFECNSGEWRRRGEREKERERARRGCGDSPTPQTPSKQASKQERARAKTKLGTAWLRKRWKAEKT